MTTCLRNINAKTLLKLQHGSFNEGNRNSKYSTYKITYFRKQI